MIKNIKTYADDIRLGKCGWIKVLSDAAVSYLVYGYNNEDYFVIGNGYTLSKYEKKAMVHLQKNRVATEQGKQP